MEQQRNKLPKFFAKPCPIEMNIFSYYTKYTKLKGLTYKSQVTIHDSQFTNLSFATGRSPEKAKPWSDF